MKNALDISLHVLVSYLSITVVALTLYAGFGASALTSVLVGGAINFGVWYAREAIQHHLRYNTTWLWSMDFRTWSKQKFREGITAPLGGWVLAFITTFTLIYMEVV